MHGPLLAHLLFCGLCERAFATGPGLGQFAYTPSELFQPIATITTPAGEGYVHMVDGYLFVPFSDDGNTGLNGGFAFFDISDPTNPTAVYLHNNAETNSMVEPHGYGFSEGKLVYCTVDGIVIWDISDPAAPAKLGTLGLGTSTGYGNVCWSVAVHLWTPRPPLHRRRRDDHDSPVLYWSARKD